MIECCHHVTPQPFPPATRAPVGGGQAALFITAQCLRLCSICISHLPVCMISVLTRSLAHLRSLAVILVQLVLKFINWFALAITKSSQPLSLGFRSHISRALSLSPMLPSLSPTSQSLSNSARTHSLCYCPVFLPPRSLCPTALAVGLSPLFVPARYRPRSHIHPLENIKQESVPLPRRMLSLASPELRV